jgi:hypothetical protein
MNLRTLVLCSLMVFPALVTQAQGIKIEISGTAGLATATKGLAADLKEARELLGKVSDKPTRERLELLITRSELKVLELEKMFAGGVVPSTGPAPMSAENFAKLLKGLKAESFDDGKKSFIATFAANGRLTSEQARQLLKEFSFDEGRISSAVVLYPRLTDPENFFIVLDVFTFDSSRSSVREKLKLNKK